MTIKILLVCVNYNSPEYATAYIDSIAKCDLSAINIDVVIVENSPAPFPELQSRAKTIPWLSYKVTCKNSGYFGGLRDGLCGYNCQDFDYVVCSNVDLLMTDPQFFQKLVKHAPQISGMAIAPAIESGETGANLNPYLIKRPSRKKMRFNRMMFSFYWVSVAYQRLSVLKSYVISKRKTAINIGVNQKIYAGHGSFFILAKEFFTKGGDLKHPCFLFGEELYIAEQIKNYNCSLWYAPELKLYHEERVSTGRIKSRRMASLQAEAMDWGYRYLYEDPKT